MKYEVQGWPGTQDFLNTYWGKHPVLIRAAIPNFKNPMSPEELASLACEPDFPSRLIKEVGPRDWRVRHGPFTADDFTSMPATHWTVLVQEVDDSVPEVAALWQHIPKIPSWRRDDIMVSYAADAGSVGPHTDQYDVFLLQGLGQRRWSIGLSPVENASVIEDLDIAVLREFTPERSWVLNPGDMLYLPPRYAHHGIALGPCMTYSLGFRAPGLADILTRYINDYAETLNPDQRYEDPELLEDLRIGRISNHSVEKIRQILQSIPVNHEMISTFWGKLITEPVRREPLDDPTPKLSATAFTAQWSNAAVKILRNESCRFAYDQEALKIFIDGTDFPFSKSSLDWVENLCNQDKFAIVSKPREEETQSLAYQLYQNGYLIMAED